MSTNLSSQINRHSRRGFTLVELLVAISIVAIISAVGYINYSTAQVNARDSRRKQDLRSIQVALELYKQSSSSKTYPATTGDCCITGALLSSSDNPWIPALTTAYINSMPKDPKDNEGNPLTGTDLVLGYSYWSGTGLTGGNCPSTTQGQYFILTAGLENTNDSERDGTKNYKDCAGASITDNPNAYIITSE